MSPSTPSRQARVVTIGPEQAGQRLDNFLCACFRDVPRSRLYRSLRSGEVRVNKGRARQTYRLQVGDHVRLPPLASTGSEAPAPSSRALAERGEQLSQRVVYEDEHVLVVDKPAGWAVHAGSGPAVRDHRVPARCACPSSVS